MSSDTDLSGIPLPTPDDLKIELTDGYRFVSEFSEEYGDLYSVPGKTLLAVIRLLAAALRRAEAAEAWKESAISVEQEWDCQALARELELPLGCSIRAELMPAVKSLKGRFAAAEAKSAERARAEVASRLGDVIRRIGVAAHPAWIKERLEEIYNSLVYHNHEYEALAAAEQQIAELRAALHDSNALNINVFTECSDETKAYYSEYKAVREQAEKALAASEGQP